MAYKLDRVDESRQQVWLAFMQAFGSYVEQEGKKADQWRDQTVYELVRHIDHEVDEIAGNVRRGEPGFGIHNCYDVMSLAAILHAKLSELAGLQAPVFTPDRIGVVQLEDS